MTVDLLAGLSMPSLPAGTLSHLESEIRAAKRQLESAAENMRQCFAELKGSAQNHWRQWQRIVLAVADGQTEDAQATREQALASLERALGELLRVRDLADLLRMESPGATPNPDELNEEIEGLKKLKTDVFDRWHTVEDLERLAVEHYPLTHEQIKQFAATHSPPPEWYAGEEEILW
jgi:hypothetical protein